jgi:hypothetical protein
LGYETFLPLEAMFDIEDASFAGDVFPWLNGDVVLAYREFDGPLSANQNDILMILPVSDMFLAASRLNRIIEGQNLAERDTYRGVELYIGDKSTMALTPHVVLVGSTELVQAALDLQAGEGESISEQPAYQAIQAAVPEDALAFAYITGENAPAVLSLLLSGAETPDPLFEVAGDVLRDRRGEEALETLLLTGEVNSAGFILQQGRQRPLTLEASVVVYTDNAPSGDSTGEFDTSLLDLVPRSAMIVHRGTDVDAAINDLLVALPFSNFAGRMLAGFPLNQTVGSLSGLIEDPTANDVQTAITGMLSALESNADFDLEGDLLDHLTGSYVVALLPSPNEPVPFLNTPFDTILMAKVNDGDAALVGATQLIEMLLGVQDLPTETIENQTFSSVRLSGSGDAVIRLGIVDDTLIIGTGRSPEQALAAQRGDNRLTHEVRWQVFTEDDAPTPDLYVDLNGVYNTFFPAPGGTLGSSEGIRFGLTASLQYRGDGVFSVDMVMTLPS